MKLAVRRSTLTGAVDVPGSKSHTIRAVAIASLASGKSTIRHPLISQDTQSCVATYQALGSDIDTSDPTAWVVHGFAGRPIAPESPIDVGNSGTTLRIAAGTAGLLQAGQVTFDGDEQIRRRPIEPLLKSLVDLGASASSVYGNGCAPVQIGGTLVGGQSTLRAVTSQYLTSLLIAAPLAEGESRLDVVELNERPYVDVTLDWLASTGVSVTHTNNMARFVIPGGQAYRAFDRRVAADFSSATFFLCASAMPGNRITCRGLDMNDAQGDKAVVGYLRSLGGELHESKQGLTIMPGQLRGGVLDLNDTPDALPALAAMACFADGPVSLTNVPQARLKETDRIDVMANELGKLGAKITQQPDGLTVEPAKLQGTAVHGHHDHRVVMALAIAATAIDGETIIDTAEAIGVTYPQFVDHMRALGGDVTVIDE